MRRRAVIVCASCHERKVRCDLGTGRGARCSQCAERGLDCAPRARKAYNSTRRKKRRQRTVVARLEDSRQAVETTATNPWSDAGRIIASVISQPSSRKTVLYAGESGYGSIMEALGHKDDAPRHVTVQGAPPTALLMEDLRFLQAKGCFELPAKSDLLFTAFFRFVHPLFPVLDGPLLAQQFEADGLERMNLLLLWSMFAVSASYVPEYASKETKASFMRRGRALFDLGGEKDRIVLLQSALLLSFWFDDPEDVKQSWYWSGIAFSIAQTLGLHKQLVNSSLRDNQTENRVWSNIWHCCLVRDVWLSYSMGRPLRLLGAVHDSNLLLATECGFADIYLDDKRTYLEADAEKLETMWRRAVAVADALRQALADKSDPRFESIEKLQTSMARQEESMPRFVLSLANRHLRLCQKAALLAVCQLSDDKSRADAAAEGIVETIQSYFDDSTTAFVPPSIVPLVMPAMVASLGAIKTGDPQRMVLGETRVNCCLRLLTAIEHSYPAASIVKQLFNAALAVES